MSVILFTAGDFGAVLLAYTDSMRDKGRPLSAEDKRRAAHTLALASRANTRAWVARYGRQAIPCCSQQILEAELGLRLQRRAAARHHGNGVLRLLPYNCAGGGGGVPLLALLRSMSSGVAS